MAADSPYSPSALAHRVSAIRAAGSPMQTGFNVAVEVIGPVGVASDPYAGLVSWRRFTSKLGVLEDVVKGLVRSCGL